MTKNKKMFYQILSLIICLAMLVSYIPARTFLTAAAAPRSAAVLSGITADPGTAHTWETMMGTGADGNRYAGRVWVDKSVYTNGQTALLNTSGNPGSSFQVALENNESFQIIFSALGSSMSTTTTNSTTGPMDVVLVLDTSTSMDDTNQGVTRLQRVIEAANLLISDLLTIPNIRISVVTYNADSETVLNLDSYTNGVTLEVTNYFNSGTDKGVVRAYDNDRNLLGQDDGYHSGTNLQSGIDMGLQALANAENTSGRAPVAIVLTDGQANRAVRSNWYNIANGSVSSSSGTGMILSTLLNAAFNKANVEKAYGRDLTVYSIGVDLGESSEAHALMNPGSLTNGFNSSSSHSNIRSAYNYFTQWSQGNTVTIGNSSNRWTFDHNFPTANGITRQDIVDNIHYVDTYYHVSSEQLNDVFVQIYEVLASGAFNPISSSSTATGGTGVENTPLIFVDFIGQYMEIKHIQAVTLFGTSYDVVDNGDGTYTVETASGVNPTTGESYITSEDIRISVTRQADGSQKLEIRIDQEILPILLQQVNSSNISGSSSASIYELSYDPLRIYYTVGLDANILLPSGEVDITKIDSNYLYIDDTTGQITFYSNAFGQMNGQDADGNGLVDAGDAHVGFQPSPANRYYYHQSNQGIFLDVTRTDGTAIQWDASEYGVLFKEGAYDFTWLSYEQYLTLQDNDQVYTYVSYYRPTANALDAASAAEEVTYIVYTNWGYLKESVAFFDAANNTYVNYHSTAGYTLSDTGYAPAADQIASLVEAYTRDFPNAQLYAVLGVGSLRTSRLHNRTVAKSENATASAEMRYAPEYTHSTASLHNGNSVVVWLGNNGRLTTTVDTGIALTKEVTESFGNPNDTYQITVTIPAGVNATPVVKDDNGQDVTAAISTFQGNVLTVSLKAGQTVYVSGIPAGTVCAINEVINGDYYIASNTGSVTIPTISQVLSGTPQFVSATVTNAPNKYGNLFITKEIESNHTIPAGILDEQFQVEVSVGTALAGKTFQVVGSQEVSSVTVDAQGKFTLSIRATQTLEILGLPEGTVATVTEQLTASQQEIFSVSYRTRNHSGENADSDNTVIIPADGNSTAILLNSYTPKATSVDLDIAGTKQFVAEAGAILPGGSFTFHVQQWNGSEWVGITGKTATAQYAPGESGERTFRIEDVLSGIVYTEAGSWAYQVLEVVGDVENVTYDRTLFTFTVTVTDVDGQLVATITDMHNSVITGGTYDVTFVNTFHTAPVSIDVTKEVENLSGDPDVSKAGFGFLAIQTDSSFNPLAGGVQDTIYTDASGHARFAATYTTAGTYYYLITEVNGGLPGWTYSDAQYRVTVTVVEDNGNLTATMTIEAVSGQNATVSGNSGSITFTNTFDPQDVTVELDSAVRKSLTGRALADGEFTFYVYADGTTDILLTGTNDTQGNVTFNGNLTFDRVGKYQFDVVEASGNLAGVTYDSTIYDLVVEVTVDHSTGKLVANWYFEDATDNTVTFRNLYTVTATSYTFTGSKVLTGRALAAGEFTFELYEGDQLLETVTNHSDGTFAFSTIHYTEAGEYVYTIREAAGNVAGITYTGAQHPITITVTVTDIGGALVASADVSNTQIRFENSYHAASAEVSFQGTKTLVGAELSDNTFSFQLYQTDHTFQIAGGQLLAEDMNENGAFYLGNIVFNTPGTYFYVIVEDATDPITNVVYDRTEHRFSVQVSDVGDGQLRVVVQNMNTGVSTTPSAQSSVQVTFTNATFDEATEKEVYLAADVTTEIDGMQVNEGDVLTYFITYTNYTGKDVVVDILDTIPEYTTYVEGSASHDGTYSGAHINWILHVAAGESVTVSFQVTVTETNAIVANTALVRDGVNTYTTNEVINHTVEDVVEKDAVTSADPTISIDGNTVVVGDTLIYTITYTNITGEAVDVTILDTIPTNTVYVDGSADMGGIYADGTITWELLGIAPWESVTVSFQVTVTAAEGGAIENQATVLEGANTYTTNEVTNSVIEDVVEKDVAIVTDPTVSVDGNIVMVGDVLVYTITYTNVSGEAVDVTILDTIPANTAYVEGSADMGGIYADGAITWELTDIAPWASVTVSFQVTVTAAEGGTIENQATVLEGTNTYTTNVVSNPTELDVPPVTGDHSTLWLWMALMVVSGSGLMAFTAASLKKKSEQN